MILFVQYVAEILEIQSFVRGDDHPVTQRTQKLIDALSQKLSKIEAFGSEAFLISDFTYQDANGDDQSRASTKTAELEASPRTAADFMKNAHIFAYQDKNWLESLRCLEKVSVWMLPLVFQGYVYGLPYSLYHHVIGSKNISGKSF